MNSRSEIGGLFLNQLLFIDKFMPEFVQFFCVSPGFLADSVLILTMGRLNFGIHVLHLWKVLPLEICLGLFVNCFM